MAAGVLDPIQAEGPTAALQPPTPTSQPPTASTVDALNYYLIPNGESCLSLETDADFVNTAARRAAGEPEVSGSLI
jgi:hypothetical protein